MGWLTEIITDLIEAIILLCIFEIFMHEKKFIFENKIKSVAFCLILTIFLYFSSTYITLMYHTLINIIFTILLLIFIFRINIWSATILYFIFYVILLVTEMLVGAVEMIVLNTNMEQILSNRNYLIIFLVVVKSLQILIVILLYRFNLSIKNYKIFSNDGSIYLNFLLSLVILGIFTLGICFVSDAENTTIYNALLFGLYLSFFILSIRDLREKDRLIKIKNKYQIQESHIKNMEQIISIIRKEKHDFANHINVIQALCTSNKPNAIERIKEYVSEISYSIHNSFKYLNTGNDYIDGLLSIKNGYALDNGIDFQVNIGDPLSDLPIKAKDLISIISNLVDNSFEAFSDNEPYDIKEVFFDTNLNQDKYIIEIGNNAREIPPEIKEHIFKKGFSTKGDKNSNHGYGLYIVKELVEKNCGIINVESDEFETIFKIIFDLRKVNA